VAGAAKPAAVLDIGGRRVPVRLRRHGRARRIVLRLERDGQGIVVTLPKRVPEAEGVAWARNQETWIARRLANLPERREFHDGAVIPFAGEEHVIRHHAEARRGVWREAGAIMVSGRAEHLSRRVHDWLRRQAREQLTVRVGEAAASLDARPGRITVRDTRSRWGSCASNGNLSFCWRLILAPPFVLDYVVAHEVAHLIEPNHGPAFWRTVAAINPDTERARAWLRENGEALHFYG